jgi:hypothetical protein
LRLFQQPELQAAFDADQEAVQHISARKDRLDRLIEQLAVHVGEVLPY